MSFAIDINFMDAGWEEQKHPRGKSGGEHGGQFVKKGEADVTTNEHAKHAGKHPELHTTEALHKALTLLRKSKVDRGNRKVIQGELAKRMLSEKADGPASAATAPVSVPAKSAPGRTAPPPPKVQVVTPPVASSESGPRSNTPLRLADMKQVGGRFGSNPGGVYEHANGNKYYLKHSKSNEHARNEILASKLYEATGAPALASHPVDLGNGKLGTATAWRAGAKPINRQDPTHRAEAQKHFATHAWLANWDAVGLDYDNQAVLDNLMTTLDVGGALNYRAQGGPKGQAFGSSVPEWDSLRDPNKNYQAHSIFGKMTPQQLKQSAAAVAAVTDAKIKDLVALHGPGDELARTALADKLIARKRDLLKRASLM